MQFVARTRSWPQSIQHFDRKFPPSIFEKYFTQLLSEREEDCLLRKSKRNTRRLYRNMLPAFLGKDLLCFGKYLRTSFLIAHVFFFLFSGLLFLWVFLLLFHLFSLCLGYSRLACSLKWCGKITLMAAVRHFGILPAKYAVRENKKLFNILPLGGPIKAA